MKVGLTSASCGYMFRLMLRAIEAHAASKAAEELLLLADDGAVHERHALFAHGLVVAPGFDVADPPPIPESPWAGSWEE